MPVKNIIREHHKTKHLHAKKFDKLEKKMDQFLKNYVLPKLNKDVII